MRSRSEDKLRAEWFWCDRWARSSARALSIAHRGLYREMLTVAWSMGAKLPADHEDIRRLVGVDSREWRALWPKVAPYWRVDGDFLVNDTQVEVYAEAVRQRDIASNRGRKGAAARHSGSAQVGAQAHAQAVPEQHSSSAQAVPSVSDPLSVKNTDRDARAKADQPKRIGYADPHGFRRDPSAAAYALVSEQQQIAIPGQWWERARKDRGLAFDAVDAFASWLAEQVRGGLVVGAKKLQWLDEQLSAWQDSLRPEPVLYPDGAEVMRRHMLPAGEELGTLPPGGVQQLIREMKAGRG